MYDQNFQEWAGLVRALKLGAPTPEYKVLQLAAQRIKELEDRLQTEHDDCVKAAEEVFPDPDGPVMYFAHQAVWTLVREVQRLRALNNEINTLCCEATGKGGQPKLYPSGEILASTILTRLLISEVGELGKPDKSR